MGNLPPSNVQLDQSAQLLGVKLGVERRRRVYTEKSNHYRPCYGCPMRNPLLYQRGPRGRAKRDAYAPARPPPSQRRHLADPIDRVVRRVHPVRNDMAAVTLAARASV